MFLLKKPQENQCLLLKISYLQGRPHLNRAKYDKDIPPPRLSTLNAESYFSAFAELQTDMTDLTADLVSSGIPMLDHTNYILKVFFPGVIDHPILNEPKVCHQ